MLDVKTYIKELEKTQRPEFSYTSTILLENPVQLRLKEMPATETTFSVARVLFKHTKTPRKPLIKSLWDADLKGTAPGYFDETGNFLISKPKKLSFTWIAKRNDSVEGPFSEKEFREFVSNVIPDDYFVRRDCDKGFVNLSKLLNELPDFLTSKELNKYFSKNQEMDESKKTDSFFDEPIFAGRGSRLTNFLRNCEIHARIDFIMKSIKGHKKADAVDILTSITGLEKTASLALLDLIIESSDCQILSDVDKDGFYIGRDSKNTKKR